MSWLLRVSRRLGHWDCRDTATIQEAGLTGFVIGTLLRPDSVPEALGRLAQAGETALSSFRGQFVLAATDSARRETWIVRDPFGMHPVFYAVTKDDVLVADSVSRLLEEPGISRTLNRAAVADHLCKRWPDNEETFFDAVRRVPPGCLLHVSDSGVSVRPYWTPSGHVIDWLPDEGVDRFDDLLDQAVSRGLAGRAGVFLSGGFDSVSVAAVAADLSRRSGRPSPRALSIGFPDPACNEEAVQSRVAQQLSLPLTLVPFAEAAGPRGLLREALDLNHGLAAPLFNTWMPIYLHLIRRGREAHVDTILTGEGGDEWLGASPYFTADLMRRGDLAGVVRMARTWHRSYHQDWLTVARGTLWRYGLRPIAGMWCSRLAPTLWDNRRARKVIQATPDWIVDDPDLQRTRRDRARRSLTPADPPGGFYSREGIGAHGHTLQSWLFEEQFQLGRALGVRYVHPYWDPDLAMHLSRVRPERLNEHDRTKALVRRTLARRFPALGFERQRKVAAMDFFAGILRQEGPSLGEAVADFQGLAALGIVVPAAARDFMRRAWTGSPREVGHAWNLVNMETWVRRHLQ